MSTEPEYIGIDDTFTFACNNTVSCFNQCCCDVNQFLYPYDVLRLKNSLGISSAEFLDTYCITYSGDTTGLPVVSFKTTPENGHACPFVSDTGCQVYNDRPSSCRIFPLARAISRSRETGKITEHYALIKDPVCQGFITKKSITVREWVSDQEMDEYNHHNDRMIELISLKQQLQPGPLDDSQKEKFVMALYNLDLFRAEILTNDLLGEGDSGKEIPELIKSNDIALLDAGMSWIRTQLFGSK